MPGDPAVPEGLVDGAVALGVVLGIDEDDDPDELDPELVLGLVDPGLAPVFESLQATVPATVKQAMAINAAVRNVRILGSLSKWAPRRAAAAQTHRQLTCRTVQAGVANRRL